MAQNATFEVFQDNANEWRWRLVASNGNIIADSGEGYRSKQGAKRGIESVKRSAPEAHTEVLDSDQ
ncbi:HVO_2922 family protein [Halobellus rufus]|uniref:HVO_2922 family protein n=1 Tax=Halobellus rufus TaxID=1448860 RepID=UPI0009E0822C|nr:HVO_2922 family protein [Halobellus rufus]